jgi:AcrR family transcriptional regulator
MSSKQPRSNGVSPGQKTRLQLIETAARHFAQHGFAGASQRAIQREAGVNSASAHYHFGSKRDLYRAVIETFVHGVQAERIARHEALPAALRGRERLERVLYDYFWPGIAIAADPAGRYYALILARVQGEVRDETSAIFLEVVRPVRSLYLRSLMELFPNATHDDLEECLSAGVTLMATTPLRHPPRATKPKVYADRHTGNLARGHAAAMIALFGEPAGE